MEKQLINLTGDVFQSTLASGCHGVVSVASQLLQPICKEVYHKAIVQLECEQKYCVGNVVAVHCSLEFLAYCFKGAFGDSLHVFDVQTSKHAFISSFSGQITDVGFADVVDKVIIAAVDNTGCLRVVQVLLNKNRTIEVHTLFELKAKDGMPVDQIHRVHWCPCSTDPLLDPDEVDSWRLLCVVHGNRVDLLNLQRSWNIGVCDSYLTIAEHEQPIVDVLLSPDGSMLATASLDGYVKFFSIDVATSNEARCVRSWQPHSGKPLTAIFFLDSRKVCSDEIWKFLVTTADDGRELKLWNCASWSCLQTVKLLSSWSATDRCQLAPCIKAQLNPTASFLVHTDVKRQVLFIMNIEHNSSNDSASVCSISKLLLPHPCLSLSVFDTEIQQADSSDGEFGVKLKLYVVLTKELQELHVLLKPAICTSLTKTRAKQLESGHWPFESPGHTRHSMAAMDNVENGSQPAVSVQTGGGDGTLATMGLSGNVTDSESFTHVTTMGLSREEQSLGSCFSLPAPFLSSSSERNYNQTIATCIESDVTPSAGRGVEETRLCLTTTKHRSGYSVTLENCIFANNERCEFEQPADGCVCESAKNFSVVHGRSSRTECRVPIEETTSSTNVSITHETDEETLRIGLSGAVSMEGLQETTSEILSMLAKQQKQFTKLYDRVNRVWNSTESQLNELPTRLDDIATKVATVVAEHSSESPVTDVESVLIAVADNEKQVCAEMLKNLTPFIDETLAEQLQASLQYEMNNYVLPYLGTSLEPVIEGMRVDFADKLTAVNTLLKDNIYQLIKSKSVHAVGETAGLVVESYFIPLSRDLVIPTFERCCHAIHLQLQAAYTNGVEQCVEQLSSGKLADNDCDPYNDRIQQTVYQLQSVANSLQMNQENFTISCHKVRKLDESLGKSMAQLREDVYAALDLSLNRLPELVSSILRDTLHEELANALDDQQKRICDQIVCEHQRSHQDVQHVPISTSQSRVSLDVCRRLLSWVSSGQVNTAFEQALSLTNLDVLMYLCRSTSPNVVFGDERSKCPLRQTVLLSSIQQLSADLLVDSDLKTCYLEDAIQRLDHCNVYTTEHFSSLSKQIIASIDLALRQSRETLSSECRRRMKLIRLAAASCSHVVLTPKLIGR